jgi:murein DD-endopeptidase MepM/ murein hydrolase activator NlpD
MKIVFLILLALYSYALEITNTYIDNGRTSLLIFDNKKNIQEIVVGKKSYKVFPHPQDKHKSYVLLPISYYETPKTLKVQVGKDFVFYKVQKGDYKQERIEVQKSKVNPKSEAVKKRTAKEYAQAMKIYNTITPKSYVNSQYIVPLQSKITSDFGKARIYNGSLSGYHSGTDFRAKVGTPIIASNDGKVVLAKNRFYAGNSVIIDHGEGIYTCYYHLSEFRVQKGDIVKKGQLLALSGDTGRITGPHLHFCVRVGGVQVDPLQLINLLNNNLYKD